MDIAMGAVGFIESLRSRFADARSDATKRALEERFGFGLTPFQMRSIEAQAIEFMTTLRKIRCGRPGHLLEPSLYIVDVIKDSRFAPDIPARDRRS